MGDWAPAKTQTVRVKTEDDEDEEFNIYLWTIPEKKK